METWGNFGCGFTHSTSSTWYKKPSYIQWAYNELKPVTFWCDNAIKDGIAAQCSRKFAWLVESRDIIRGATDFVRNNIQLVSDAYEYLFTHDKEIYDLADNFIFLPSHCTWIENPQIYPKNKLVSLISSNKGWTDGHRRRLSLIEKFRNGVDLYGSGYRWVDTKEEALKDYFFSICIENDRYPTYFSEKLLDCFACGTIPVYYGSPDIAQHFDADGIIFLDDDFSLDMLTPEVYSNKLASIRRNLEIATKYNTVEDILYKTWLNPV